MNLNIHNIKEGRKCIPYLYTYKYSSKVVMYAYVCMNVCVCYAFQMITGWFACCMLRACICLFHSFFLSLSPFLTMCDHNIPFFMRRTQYHKNKQRPIAIGKMATSWINIIRCLFVLVLGFYQIFLYHCVCVSCLRMTNTHTQRRVCAASFSFFRL